MAGCCTSTYIYLVLPLVPLNGKAERELAINNDKILQNDVIRSNKNRSSLLHTHSTPLKSQDKTLKNQEQSTHKKKKKLIERIKWRKVHFYMAFTSYITRNTLTHTYTRVWSWESILQEREILIFWNSLKKIPLHDLLFLVQHNCKKSHLSRKTNLPGLATTIKSRFISLHIGTAHNVLFNYCLINKIIVMSWQLFTEKRQWTGKVTQLSKQFMCECE